MKTVSFLTFLAAIAVANSVFTSVDPANAKTEFGGNTAPISLDGLHAMKSEAPLVAQVVRVTVRIEGIENAPPAVEVKRGQKAVVEVIREFRYPTEFDLPSVDPKTKAFTPATPTTFEVMNTGSTMEIEWATDGPFVVLFGKFLSTKFEGFTQNAGAPFRPIADKDGKQVSTNHVKTPMFTTRTTPFFAALQPGKEDAFSVLTDDGFKRLTVKCEVVR